MDWFQSTEGGSKSEAEACHEVAVVEFPAECGGCTPPPQPPPPPAPPSIKVLSFNLFGWSAMPDPVRKQSLMDNIIGQQVRPTTSVL